MTSEEIKQQNNIGTTLKDARVELGENLAQVANNLRIRQVYLEALENNQFDLLPGSIYVIGFIRSYSEYLNLNAEEIIKKYKESTNIVDNKPDLKFPAFVPESGIPGGAILLVGLFIAFFGYASWYFFSNQKKFAINQVPNIPNEMQTKINNKKASNKNSKSNNKVEGSNLKKIIVNQNNEKALSKTGKPPKKDQLTPEIVAKRPTKILGSESSTTEDSSAIDNPTLIKSKSMNASQTKKETLPISQTKKETLPISQTKKEILPVSQTKEDTPTASPSKIEELNNAPENTEKREVVSSTAPIEYPKDKIVKRAVDQEKDNTKTKNNDTKTIIVAPIKEKKVKTFESRISILAVTDSYIQVRDNDNSRLLITRLLKKSQRYEVPNRPNLSLITGNAGALQIFVDGTLAPSIGPVGKVRRNVILDADKLRDGQAVLE